jgi:hypothetical protein
MNTSEIFNPAQRKKRVVENFLNSQFGLKLQARGDAAQVQSLIAKLVNENQSMASSVRGYENDSRFVKNTMIIEALKHVLKEIAPMRSPRRVNESNGENLAQAELILVAKNMVEELQKMAEDVAQMQTDDLMPLVEKIKVEFGQDVGQQFNDAADAAFTALLDAVKTGKDALSNAQGILSGEAPAAMPGGDMGADATGELDALGAEQGLGGDEFGGADAASGEEELPTGRELK